MKKFDELVNLIDLAEYVQHCGYVYDKNKSSKQHKVFKKKEGGKTVDGIIIKDGVSSQFYNNTNISSDKGNLIKFVMNRLNSSFVSVNTTRNDYVKVSKILNEYLGIPTANRIIQKPDFVKVDFKEGKEVKDFNIYLHKARKLTNYSILKERGISEETINLPLLKNRIVEANDFNHKTEKSFPYSTTGFPLWYKGSIVGLELRGKKMDNGKSFKKYSEYSNKQDSLWVTNRPQKATSLYVAESPIDAISHLQMKGTGTEIYSSTGGNLGQNQIAEMLRVATDSGVKKIISITDNDIAGCDFDFKIIQQLDIDNRIKPIENEAVLSRKIELTYQVSPGIDEGRMRSLFNFLSKYNNKQKELVKEYSDKEDSRSDYINIFRAASKEDKSYTIKVPNVLEARMLFNERLTKLLNLKFKMEFDKSVLKDWNEDLVNNVHKKESLEKNEIKKEDQSNKKRHRPKI